MRQDTVPVIELQVRAHTPPDHAGVECDNGNDCACTGYSCWVAVYQCDSDLASVIFVIYFEFSK
jgi:hypothetical protein